MTVSSGNHWARRNHARKSYAFVRRMCIAELSRAYAGENNPLYNDIAFDWFNYRTKETRTETMYAMWLEFGGNRASWTMVANGDRPSILGWLLVANQNKHNPHDKGVPYRFLCADGREFCGTQSEFSQVAQISAAQAFRVAKEGAVTKNGWRLHSTPMRKYTTTRDGRASAAAGSGRVYSLVHRSGERFRGTAAQFRDHLGCAKDFAMSGRLSLLCKQPPHYTLYGWAVAQQNKHHANDNVQLSLFGYAA